MPQAALVTPRLRLVPLSDEHLELEVELDSDPEVMRHLTGRASSRDEIQTSHRRRLATATQVDGLGVWVGFLGDDFVGWWVLRPPQRPGQGAIDGNAELGYRLLRRFWRQGLAREGSRALLRHGFTDLGLRRIFAETRTENIASQATMTAIGLRYARAVHLGADQTAAGEPDAVEYDITREQWLAGQQPD